MIVGENNFGPQPFLLQVRSLEDHKPMPGIRVGDLGTKIGYNAVCNGWLAIDNVRIPRDHYLQGFTELDRDGNFSVLGDTRMLYQVMLKGRGMLCFLTAHAMLQGLTVAVRYSVCRR